MIAEIVSNGMLSLPSSLAVVGLVPGVIIIVFLGSFALFTSWILIQFKLRHPEGKEVLFICLSVQEYGERCTNLGYKCITWVMPALFYSDL